MPTEITAIYTFIKTAAELKELIRYQGQFYWKDYPSQARYESVADHSWRLALMAVLIAPKLSQPVNLERMLKMALIHDLPEILVGDASPMGTDGTGKDTHAFNEQKRAEKAAKEHAAAKKLFSALPSPLGDELFALWQEAEAQETFEAKVLKTLDKMEANIQVLRYREGNVFAAHKEFMQTYGLRGNDVDPATEALAQEIAREIDEKFVEFTK